MDTSVISVNPEVMGGTPVFRGTRVPIQTFIDHLGSDDEIKDFFDGFPGVSQEQVIELLEEVKEKVLVVS
uniref:DUF433 domain-containing protein n=1 Tax=Candidatus Kentrum sp. UNK TaxID=2126344 RepID=A0A451AHM7_9GAMM|nr:MAG: Protein of unknown function (DUF433) [Candidatus Kentron sp. UNK]VFK71523.1 MAG: Protein of unknown function (DUF433) [Candidatus Kentron sp. UNK]